MARILLSGAFLASSSRPSSQLIVRSLCNFVTALTLGERFPSHSVATSCLAPYSLTSPAVSNVWCKSTNQYAACSRQLLQPALLRSTPRRRYKETFNLVNHNSGGLSRVMGESGFSTDDSPAINVTPEDVLHYWFKDADLAKNQFPMKFWYSGGDAVDKEITEKFRDCLDSASSGKLDHWKATARGRVALVLVLDQFSRNCYRDSSRCFAQDDSALKITLDSVAQGLDQQLRNPLERYFLYMPLMHSELPEVHAKAQLLFQKLADDHKDNPELHKLFQYVVKFEKAHHAVLTKFGRYPSRNAVLGRESTPEEEEYLAAGVVWPMED